MQRSLTIFVFAIIGIVISEILNIIETGFSIGIIAIIFGITILYTANRKRREILQGVDYSVLVFSAAMFVFTSALWISGLVPLIMAVIPDPTGDDKMENIIRDNALISSINIY